MRRIYVSEQTNTIDRVDEIIEKYELSEKSLIPVLQDVQDLFHYLSEESLKRISEKLDIPLSRIYAVATFYNAFSLEPKGKYIIQVCMGTACHVRGAPAILEEAERLLGIERGKTSNDKMYTLETVNCVGACALGPIMIVNGKYHGHMVANKVKNILKEYR